MHQYHALALCASLIFVSQASAQQRPSALPRAPQTFVLPDQLRAFVPTEKNFGRRFILSPAEYSRPKGNTLLCKANAEDCIVKRMPLLAQGDPRLSAPLAAFLSNYATNGSVTIKGKSAPIDQLVSAILGYGCYITSQVTLIITSLANRTPSLALSGRTAMFDELGEKAVPPDFNTPVAGEEALPRYLQKLLWQYKIHFRREFQLQPGDKNLPYLSFPAVVKDVTGGISPTCDLMANPFCQEQLITGANNDGDALYKSNPSSAELTNESVQGLMLEDRVVLLAYSRWKPSTAYDRKSGTLTVTLTWTSMHKVAVSGFQAEDFPLLINDVGIGETRKVRLSADLGSLKFGSTANNAAVPKKIVYEYKHNGKTVDMKGRPFLGYEGEIEKPNPRVFFIDNYEYLHLRSGPKPVEPPGKGNGGKIPTIPKN
jgi:hypothetical protein